MSEPSIPFLEESQHFWQKRTDRQLSEEDVRQIVANLTGFFRVLAEWAGAEECLEKRQLASVGAGGRQ
jgi:hypothetical protein